MPLPQEKSAYHKKKWSLAPGKRKKGREEISTQILSESRRDACAWPRRPAPANASGSGATVPPPPRPGARPGPRVSPRRRRWGWRGGNKYSLLRAATRREPLPRHPREGGAARPLAPAPSPHGPVPSEPDSGPARPPIAGAAPAGGLRPAPSRRSLGALVVRAARLPPASSSSLLPSPARPSARTHPPSSCLPGPRCVCAALPLRLPGTAGAAGRVGE